MASAEASDAACPPCGAESRKFFEEELPSAEKLCAQGDGKACFDIGTTVHGRPWCCEPGFEIDRVAALRMFLRSCDLGFEPACHEAWRTLTPIFKGKGLNRGFLTQACDAGIPEGCHYLAKATDWHLYLIHRDENDFDLFKSYVDVLPIHKRACGLGSQQSCAEFAFWSLLEGDIARSRAVSTLEAACYASFQDPRPDLDDYHACQMLALVLERAATLQDRHRARKIRHAICLEADHFCGRLFASETFVGEFGYVWPPAARWTLWGVEALVLLAAQGLLLAIVRRRRFVALPRKHKVLVSGLGLLATVSAMLIATEVWFYFWGSRYESFLYLALSGVLLAPLLVRALRPPRAGSDSSASPS